MIVRFFKSGTSSGESPIHYLLRMRDHEGNLRTEVPEVLAGSPHLTIELINGITRKHKYSSGCLAFRPEETPSRAELFKIIDRFKEVVAPGLSTDQFNSLFVIHQEPPDPKTGVSGFHVHFVLPMTLLGGVNAKGKPMAGKRWNPHPPGQMTIEMLSLFTQLTNQQHGWSQVAEKPLGVGMDAFWRKADATNQKAKIDILALELRKAVKAGRVANRAELITYMDETLGLAITRTTDTTVSVKFPGSRKAVKLRGMLFEEQTDFLALRSVPRETGTEMLSAVDYRTAQQRLDELIRIRAVEIQGIGQPRRTHKNTTTRKERVYGRRSQKRTGGDRPSREDLGRVPRLPLTKSGMERNLLQAGAGQWRHEDGRNDPPSYVGPQEAAKPIQDAGNTGQGIAGGQQRKRGGSGWSTASGHADIEQKIWALAVELNECEVGSMEASSILMQLAVLQGERENQPKGPRPKR